MQPKTHGEIVAWSVRGSYPFSDVVKALVGAELNEKEARDIIPRNAFARSCKQLADERIIRKIDEDRWQMRFQFTKESLVGDQFEYAFETVLTLNKTTGDITCDIPELVKKANKLMQSASEIRTAPDVTRIIQRLFTKNADLFLVRDQGGCYFVPRQHQVLIEKVQKFCDKLDVKLRRFPVATGTGSGDANVREAVLNGLQDMLKEHKEAIKAFDPDTTNHVFERAANKLKATRHKLQAYACFLGDEVKKLEDEVDVGEKELKEKIEKFAIV